MNRFCNAKRCHTSGPQYMFTKCPICHGWHCDKHTNTEEGVIVVRMKGGSVDSAYFKAPCITCKPVGVSK